MSAFATIMLQTANTTPRWPAVNEVDPIGWTGIGLT
jgi:hypothetical protein